MTFRAVLCMAGLLLGVVPAGAQVSPESAAKYNEGQELVKTRRYADAIAAFEKAVELDGKNAQAYQGMGITYQKMRNYEKAAESFKMATTVKPDYTAAYYALGQLQYQALRNYEAAAESFKKVLSQDANFEEGKARTYLAASHMKQGGTFFKQRNYKRAADSFESATQVDPSNATYFYNLGLAQKAARNFDGALDALSTATDLDPKYAKAYKLMGDLYKDTRKNSNAATSYSKAIEADPEFTDAYLALATVYTDTEQHTKAISTLKKATDVDAKDKALLTALGFAYHQNKQYDSAVGAYRKALALDAGDDEANYRLAVSLFEKKEYGSAISAARKATDSRRWAVPANVILGDIYEAQKGDGWKEKAIGHYEKGLQDRIYQKYCQDKIDRIKNPMGDAEQGTGE